MKYFLHALERKSFTNTKPGGVCFDQDWVVWNPTVIFRLISSWVPLSQTCLFALYRLAITKKEAMQNYPPARCTCCRLLAAAGGQRDC